MFTKLFTISALAALAVATPTYGGGGGHGGSGGSTSQCNTGPAQCCKQTMSAQDAIGSNASLAGLIGVVAQNLNVLVGLSCSPISVIGGGNGPCNAHPVCCTNNANGGLISIGCVPISV